jgi:hypothetical protein
MAVLLDTRDLPTRQRTRAFLSAMVDATVPSYAVLERPDIDLHARFEMWELGDGAVLRCRSNTGIRLYRTPAQALRTMPPVISLSIQERAAARQEQFGHQRVLPPGELACTDLTAPYDYAWAGPGAGRALQVPVDQLGLPMDAVRRAGANLTTSPVYGLVRNHIAEVTGLAAARAGPAAPALAAASLELVRALLASACHQEGGHARAVLADTLIS